MKRVLLLFVSLSCMSAFGGPRKPTGITVIHPLKDVPRTYYQLECVRWDIDPPRGISLVFHCKRFPNIDGHHIMMVQPPLSLEVEFGPDGWPVSILSKWKWLEAVSSSNVTYIGLLAAFGLLPPHLDSGAEGGALELSALRRVKVREMAEEGECREREREGIVLPPRVVEGQKTGMLYFRCFDGAAVAAKKLTLLRMNALDEGITQHPFTVMQVDAAPFPEYSVLFEWTNRPSLERMEPGIKFDAYAYAIVEFEGGSSPTALRRKMQAWVRSSGAGVEFLAKGERDAYDLDWQFSVTWHADGTGPVRGVMRKRPAYREGNQIFYEYRFIWSQPESLKCIVPLFMRAIVRDQKDDPTPMVPGPYHLQRFDVQVDGPGEAIGPESEVSLLRRVWVLLLGDHSIWLPGKRRSSLDEHPLILHADWDLDCSRTVFSLSHGTGVRGYTFRRIFPELDGQERVVVRWERQLFSTDDRWVDEIRGTMRSQIGNKAAGFVITCGGVFWGPFGRTAFIPEHIEIAGRSSSANAESSPVFTPWLAMQKTSPATEHIRRSYATYTDVNKHLREQPVGVERVDLDLEIDAGLESQLGEELKLRIINSLRLIDAAKHWWCMEKNMPLDAEPTWEDLKPFHPSAIEGVLKEAEGWPGKIVIGKVEDPVRLVPRADRR